MASTKPRNFGDAFGEDFEDVALHPNSVDAPLILRAFEWVVFVIDRLLCIDKDVEKVIVVVVIVVNGPAAGGGTEQRCRSHAYYKKAAINLVIARKVAGR